MKTKNLYFSLILSLLITFPVLVNSMVPLSMLFQAESQERSVGSFTSISLTCSVDLYLYQGKTNKVVVEADEQYIDQIETYVEGETLVIDVKGSIRNAKVLKAYITFEQLNKLKISGSGDVVCENAIIADEFIYEISGSGDLDMKIEAETLKCKINGSGDAHIEGDVSNLSISVSGSGDVVASVDSMNECSVRLTGSGDVKLSGTVDLLRIKQVSSGDISADKLKANTCYIDKSGSGDSKVYVINELSVISSGSGDVYCKGSPDIKNVEISGSGDVHSID